MVGDVIILGKNDNALRSYWIDRGRSVLCNPHKKNGESDRANAIKRFKIYFLMNYRILYQT